MSEREFTAWLFAEAVRSHEERRLERAEQLYRQILSAAPGHPGASNNLGVLLQEQDRLTEAAEVCTAAVAAGDRSPALFNTLGLTLLRAGRAAEAVDCFQTAIAADATLAELQNNLGNGLCELGMWEEGISAYRQAITLAPEYVEAHWNLAQALLTTGRMEEGFAEYEWRWRKPDFSSPVRHAPTPVWDGSELRGQTMLLHAEQGFGDAIQFIRYVPLVKERGAGVILVECQPQLVEIFRTVPGVDAVAPFGTWTAESRLHAPLMTLPYLFRTKMESIPAPIPYLVPHRGLVREWSSRLGPRSGRMRIGVVWAGSQSRTDLRHRSCPVEELFILEDIPGLDFVSLQVGAAPEDIASLKQRFTVHDVGEFFRDFADTAAAVRNVDLVITVDTSVAHLAGALGVPVWVLLSRRSDWRWLLEREDSPWYPGMRLFRQIEQDDWGSVVRRVAARLRAGNGGTVRSEGHEAPATPGVLNTRGLELQGRGDHEEALRMFDQGIALAPGEAVLHYNRGNALNALGRFTLAAESYQEAIRRGLVIPEVWNNLGAVQNTLRKWDDAARCLEESLRILPAYAPALLNLGYTELQRLRLPRAIELLEQAVRAEPASADAHWLLSHALLLSGDLRRGLEEYEWRWGKLDPSPYAHVQGPRWRGESLQGKRILLFTEQGVGDAIQFVRFIPALAASGATVILECQPALARLFSRLPGISILVARGAPLPAYDYQCPLMSVPRMLGAGFDDLPSPARYLAPDTGLVQAWEERLGARDGSRRVGLVWAGNPHHRNDVNRSMHPSLLEPLAGLPGIRWISLQKNMEARAEGNRPPMVLESYDTELRDWEDTAALIRCCDLVVSVDTAVAHLAGAVGTPVWLLLPYVPDWRWLLRREDTPWYPRMHLFRQPVWGDWESVVERVRRDLCAAVLPPLSQGPAADDGT